MPMFWKLWERLGSGCVPNGLETEEEPGELSSEFTERLPSKEKQADSRGIQGIRAESTELFQLFPPLSAVSLSVVSVTAV